MKTTVVIYNQNIWDISIQEYGTIECVFGLILSNELSLSDDLTPGQVLKVPDCRRADKEVADYYEAKELHPATAIDKDLYFSGIGYMQIETDFIVS